MQMETSVLVTHVCMEVIVETYEVVLFVIVLPLSLEIDAKGVSETGCSLSAEKATMWSSP